MLGGCKSSSIYRSWMKLRYAELGCCSLFIFIFFYFFACILLFSGVGVRNKVFKPNSSSILNQTLLILYTDALTFWCLHKWQQIFGSDDSDINIRTTLSAVFLIG